MNYRKQKILLLLLCIVFLSQSCKTYYGSGISGGTYTYMHTPMLEENTTISKSYINARYNEDLTYHNQEENKSGELSYHYSVSRSHVNYAFGGGLFMGQYKVVNLKDKLAKLNKNYSYYGGVIRAKVAYNWSISPNFHWRVIGLQSSWFIERGSFRDFQNQLIDLGDSEVINIFIKSIRTIKDINNFYFYPYTEFSCKIGNSFLITPNFGLGFKLYGILAFRSFMGLNISYREKINLWAVKQKVGYGLVQQTNNSFISENLGNNSNIQLGISFAF